MVRQLVVTADDFGYCGERNRGIVEGFKAGSVTRASLLVTGAAALEAVRLAALHHIPLGLHFNVTEGYPVSDSKSVPSLLLEGRVLRGKVDFRQALYGGRVNLDELRLELEAQLAKFKELTGRLPVYVDGHNHIHVLPGVCDVFANVLHQAGVRSSRIPRSVVLDAASAWLLPPQRAAFYREVSEEAAAAANVFTSQGIWFSDGFVGMATMGNDMTVDRLVTLLNATYSNMEESALSKPSHRVSGFNCDMQTSRSPGSAPPCDAYLTRPEAGADGLPTETLCPARIASPLCDTDRTMGGPPVHPAGPHAVIELMVHPGYPCVNGAGGCGVGPDAFAGSTARQHELDVLTSEQWQVACASYHFELCAGITDSPDR